FLSTEGYLAHDPTALIDLPRLGRRLPRVLTDEEVLRLVGAPDGESPLEIRDRAMMHLMYASGLRVSELVALELGDVDLKAGVLAAFGKGRKRRIVPLGAVASASIRNYLTSVRPRWAPASSKLLFVTARGHGMTRQGFWKVIARYAVKAGIDKRVSPHT